MKNDDLGIFYNLNNFSKTINDTSKNAIKRYLQGTLRKKGAQGIMNLTLKSSTFSLTRELKNVALKNVINGILPSLIISIFSEIVSNNIGNYYA